MRPAGEVTLALLQAAHAIRVERAESGQGPTLAEMAARACVGYQVARNLVPKLKSRGHLQIVGTRKVPGRNRPAFEYAPADPSAPTTGEGWVDLGNALQHWAR